MKISFSEIRDKFTNSKFDMFITCASFETRCISIMNATKGCDISSYCLCRHADRDSVNGKNWSTMHDMVAHKKVVDINLFSSDSLRSYDNARAVLKEQIESRDNFEILWDISTFTRESLLFTLRVLYDLRVDHTFGLTITYCPVSEYSIVNNPNGIWLSRGIKSVRSVLGYPGNFVPSLPTRVILLCGFEIERSAACVARYDPEYLSLGSIPEKENVNKTIFQQLSSFHDRMLSYYDSSKVSSFSFSAIELHDTISSLTSIINSSSNQNLIIVPLNNKLSAFAAGLVALKNQNVGISYAKPVEYNIDGYSNPSNYMFVEKITF